MKPSQCTPTHTPYQPDALPNLRKRPNPQENPPSPPNDPAPPGVPLPIAPCVTGRVLWRLQGQVLRWLTLVPPLHNCGQPQVAPPREAVASSYNHRTTPMTKALITAPALPPSPDQFNLLVTDNTNRDGTRDNNTVTEVGISPLSSWRTIVSFGQCLPSV